MNYFDNCSVGDKVWDYVYGKGKITGIFKDQPTDYPVYVKFKLSDCNFSFSLSGKIDLCNNELPQRLFYYDNRPIVITQDDLDISADSGSYRLSSLGIDQITKEKSEFGAYGNSGCNFKDYNYSKYTRKVHREEPKLVPDDLDEELSPEELTDLYDLEHQYSRLYDPSINRRFMTKCIEESHKLSERIDRLEKEKKRLNRLFNVLSGRLSKFEKKKTK